MKLRKFAKCSLAVALIFGSAGALVGCKKDNSTAGNNSKQYEIYLLAKEAGITDLTYEEWLVSIKGDKGDTGAAGAKGEKGDKGDPGLAGSKGDKGDPGNNGSDGKDGATWLSGTTDPTTEGKNGDFYINTTNWTIFKKENNTWNKIGSLKDEKHVEAVELEANRIYKIEYDEIGVITITLDENKDVESFLWERALTDDLVFREYFLLGATQNMYLKVNDDGVTAEFVNIDEENPENKPNEAETNKKYTINNQYITTTGGMGGMDTTIRINGDLTLTGDSTNPFVFDDNFTMVMTINNMEDRLRKIEVKGNYIYAVMGETEDNTQTFVLEIEEEKDEYIQLKFLEKLDEEMLKYVEGTYSNAYFNGTNVTVSIFGEEFYLYEETESVRIKGTWNYIPSDSSINEGYYATFTSSNISFLAYIDCYSREFTIFDEEYIYSHAYYNNSNDSIELIEDDTNENGYIVKYNGQIVEDAEIAFNKNKKIIYVAIGEDVYSLNAFSSRFEFAPIDTTTIIQNINDSINYINSEIYNLPENTDVNSLLDEDKYYVMIRNFGDLDINGIINYLYINNDDYNINNNSNIYVGNNNYITKPLWKVENGKIYVSSLFLKELMLDNDGTLDVRYASIHFEINYSKSSLVSYNCSNNVIYMGLGTNEEKSVVYKDEIISNNELNTLRLYITDNSGLDDDLVYTIEEYSDTGEVKKGFTKLTKVGSSYYLYFTPDWTSGNSANGNFTLSYKFFTSSGYYGEYEFNITFSPNTGE